MPLALLFFYSIGNLMLLMCSLRQLLFCQWLKLFSNFLIDQQHFKEQVLHDCVKWVKRCSQKDFWHYIPLKLFCGDCI